MTSSCVEANGLLHAVTNPNQCTCRKPSSQRSRVAIETFRLRHPSGVWLRLQNRPPHGCLGVPLNRATRFAKLEGMFGLGLTISSCKVSNRTDAALQVCNVGT